MFTRLFGIRPAAVVVAFVPGLLLLATAVLPVL